MTSDAETLREIASGRRRDQDPQDAEALERIADTLDALRQHNEALIAENVDNATGDPRVDRLVEIAMEGIFDAMGETWTAEQDRELAEKRVEVERLAEELTAALKRR